MDKRFIVHFRNKEEGIPIIMEVEGYELTSIDDPSIMWIAKEDEFRFRIIKPTSLYEPKDSKDKTLVPPVYYSHSVMVSLSAAKAKAYQVIKGTFKEFSHERVMEKLRQVSEVYL